MKEFFRRYDVCGSCGGNQQLLLSLFLTTVVAQILLCNSEFLWLCYPSSECGHYWPTKFHAHIMLLQLPLSLQHLYLAGGLIEGLSQSLPFFHQVVEATL